MKKSILIIIALIISSDVFSQYSASVYDANKFIKLDGYNYFPEVNIDDEKSVIEYTLRDNANKIVVTTKLPFDKLPNERYISFYNRIGLLMEETGMFLYDFISKKKFLYGSGQYDRYNEGIKVGKYNPILQKSILLIVDDKLLQVRNITLNAIGKQYWLLLSEGTDVDTGKIRLAKFVKKGISNADDVFEKYMYDCVTNKMVKVN
jgi:hypothetical protein